MKGPSSGPPNAAPPVYSLSRILLGLVALVLVAGEVIPTLLGAGLPPHRLLWDMVLIEPLFASAVTGALALYLIPLPLRRNELIVVLVIGALVDLWLTGLRSQFIGPGGRLLHLGMGPGLASVGALALRALRREPRAEEALALAVALPALLVFGGFVHTFIIDQNPVVYDYYAYAFDGLTGVQPSFLISRAAASTLAFRVVIYAVYFHLALMMSVTEALGLRYPARAVSRPLLAFLLLGAFGGLLYNLFPIVGVKVLCGDAYPNGPWPPVPANLRPVEAPPQFPRNGMPSLHMAWVLAAFWALRGFGPALRIAGAVLVFITVLGTFVVGHYAVDLVVAVPFALAAHAASVKARGRRTVVIGAGAAATLGWLLAMRFTPDLLLAQPALTVTGLALTVVGSFALEAWLGSQRPSRSA